MNSKFLKFLVNAKTSISESFVRFSKLFRFNSNILLHTKSLYVVVALFFFVNVFFSYIWPLVFYSNFAMYFQSVNFTEVSVTVLFFSFAIASSYISILCCDKKFTIFLLSKPFSKKELIWNKFFTCFVFSLASCFLFFTVILAEQIHFSIKGQNGTIFNNNDTYIHPLPFIISLIGIIIFSSMFGSNWSYFVNNGIVILLNIGIFFIYYFVFIFFFPFEMNNNLVKKNLEWYSNYGMLLWTFISAVFSYFLCFLVLKNKTK
ncbi:MAG: hypothetical protein LBB39_03115 [Mycoplasmataceae bacterium]|jgi:ABC-type transport system involved in multi-copper enzyme maturation permease subunit|nr:hypothetical protein [Mycoplasmataceae bacterium]